MNTTELIAWIPIEDGPPEREGLYLVIRYDGRYSAVICENWAGVPYHNRELPAIFPQWDGDPPQGGARDGAEPEEGPVVAWAEMPRGYVEMERQS